MLDPSVYTLVRFDLVNLIRDVNVDDSFYYFNIASNLAAGRFSTFDGGVTRTNGYHPLWMLFITPFYWIFDKEAALFGIKAFEIRHGRRGHRAGTLAGLHPRV